MLLVLFSSTGYAKWSESRLGAGLKIGEPLAVSLNYFLNANTAVNVDLGFGWEDENAAAYKMKNLTFLLVADVKYYHAFFDVGSGDLPFYAGLGVRAFFKYEHVGIRVPLGAAYFFEKAPVSVFAEWAPAYVFIFKAVVNSAAVGFRYYF